MKDVRVGSSEAECCGGVMGIGVLAAEMVDETELKTRFFPVCKWCVNWKQKDDRVLKEVK